LRAPRSDKFGRTAPELSGTGGRDEALVLLEVPREVQEAGEAGLSMGAVE
jgi:hypothetical protein